MITLLIRAINYWGSIFTLYYLTLYLTYHIKSYKSNLYQIDITGNGNVINSSKP